MIDIIVLGFLLPLAVAAITVMSNSTWAHVAGMVTLYVVVDAIGILFGTTGRDANWLGAIVLAGAWVALGARTGWKRKPIALVVAGVFWAVVAGAAVVTTRTVGNPVTPFYGLDLLAVLFSAVLVPSTLGVEPQAAALDAASWWVVAFAVGTLVVTAAAHAIGRRLARPAA